MATVVKIDRLTHLATLIALVIGATRGRAPRGSPVKGCAAAAR